MSNEKLTITLTDRRPVKIDKATWALIASAKDWDNQHECQANRTWKLFVRQCQKDGDDRCIVYGIYDTCYQGEDDRRGGEIVDDIDAVPEAIKRVAEYLGFNQSLADSCIADLPAIELE